MKENHPQRKKLNRALADAADTYEQRTGFHALNWRALRSNAALQRQVDAVRADLRWFELNAQEVQSALEDVLGAVLLENPSTD